MIWQPKKGQRVKLVYKDHSNPLHGKEGLIVVVGKKPGPINCAVYVENTVLIVPRGNLITLKEETS